MKRQCIDELGGIRPGMRVRVSGEDERAWRSAVVETIERIDWEAGEAKGCPRPEYFWRFADGSSASHYARVVPEATLRPGLDWVLLRLDTVLSARRQERWQPLLPVLAMEQLITALAVDEDLHEALDRLVLLQRQDMKEEGER